MYTYIYIYTHTCVFTLLLLIITIVIMVMFLACPGYIHDVLGLGRAGFSEAAVQTGSLKAPDRDLSMFSGFLGILRTPDLGMFRD